MMGTLSCQPNDRLLDQKRVDLESKRKKQLCMSYALLVVLVFMGGVMTGLRRTSVEYE
jgi:hypothetical protein